MRQIWLVIMISALPFGLAGCGKNNPNQSVAPDAKPTATPIAILHRRDGIWRQGILLTRLDGKTVGMTTKVCIKEGADGKNALAGSRAMRAGCSIYDLERQQAGDITLRSVCSASGEGKETTAMQFHGDFDKAYTVTSTYEVTGARKPEDNGHGRLMMDATWLRQCSPGEKSGDVLANAVAMPEARPTAPPALP